MLKAVASELLNLKTNIQLQIPPLFPVTFVHNFRQFSSVLPTAALNQTLSLNSSCVAETDRVQRILKSIWDNALQANHLRIGSSGRSISFSFVLKAISEAARSSIGCPVGLIIF